MRKTIMIVDDDESILNSIKAILELEGYKVITRNKNDKHLYKLILNCSPQLILLDVLISNHDGRIICKRLKTDKLVCNIPIILVSGYLPASKNFADYGADGFIAKPFDVDELIFKIKKIIA